MSSTPRIALDERAQTAFGIIDPLPMYDPEFVRLVRETIALAYGASALDRAHWDMLRVEVAERIDCGVCKHMRDVNAVDPAARHGTGAVLVELAAQFLSAAPEIDDDLWDALHDRHGEDAIAEALLGPVFGCFHPKTMIVCGLEPSDPSKLTNTSFDASRYSVEGGAIGMVLDSDERAPPAR